MSEQESKRNSEEFVPGTVHLVDLQGILDVKKNLGSGDSSNIILVPQPTSNPNDPLRWSKSKKRAQFAFLWIWAFLQSVCVGWWGPAFEVWTKEIKGATYQTLNNYTAIVFVFLGLGCVFLQPTAMKLGRRFVYLLCSLLSIVSNIIGSQSRNIGTLYVNLIISGFAAAPVDSLVEISTTDVFFQHERAQYLSLFVFALYAGTDLGPVAAGYIVDSMGWKWCFYFLIIIFGVMMIIQVFYMEDTTFVRTDDDHLEENIICQIKSHESQPIVINSNEVKNSLAIDDEESSISIDGTIPKRTYWQRMKFVETEYNDKRSWINICCKPFATISFPAVVFGGYVYGSQMMWLSLMETTQSQIFSATPYNFSALAVGLTNIAALVGSIFGMLYGGLFVDYVSIELKKTMVFWSLNSDYGQ